jgi:hypothetical protein
MEMAEASEKTVKSKKPLIQDEKVTMQSLAKTEKPKPMEVKAPAQMQTVPKPEEKAVQTKPESQPAKAPEAPKTEAKTEVKKEADPSKEFVDGIMAEMALKGASKKRLIKTLVEQYGMDKQKVMFRLKRALITERYAAAHAEAGH